MIKLKPEQNKTKIHKTNKQTNEQTNNIIKPKPDQNKTNNERTDKKNKQTNKQTNLKIIKTNQMDCKKKTLTMSRLFIQKIIKSCNRTEKQRDESVIEKCDTTLFFPSCYTFYM